MVLTTVDQAVYRARRAPSGPIHLNLMFREPFIPEPEDREEGLPLPARWLKSGEPYTQYADTKPTVDLDEVERLWEALRPVERGLVVAGRLPSRKQGEAVLRLAESLDWPLLPDVGSQIRLGSRSESIVHYYDALLADEWFKEAHAPEAVLHFGGRALRRRARESLPPRPRPQGDAQRRGRRRRLLRRALEGRRTASSRDRRFVGSGLVRSFREGASISKSFLRGGKGP
jgi:2-succinyl-5-enolpyruvyl-6-hydroxy-3-cyclohexene-1-carboxylate synthase